MSEQRNLLCSEAECGSVFAHNGRGANCTLHPLPLPWPSRDAGQASQGWRAEEGFGIPAGIWSNAVVSQSGDVAGFIHDVAMTLRMQGEQHFSQERETCGFRQQQEGLWLACNEHLSAMPERLPPPLPM